MTLRTTRITSIDSPLFVQAWYLYQAAFPLDERRDLDYQERVIASDAYHFDVFTDDDTFVGFMLWWEFDELHYLEHLATRPELRGGGLGKQIIQHFLRQTDKLVLLEVEKPDDEMKTRRIEFYKRNGLKLNMYNYEQPPYRVGGNPVDLLLMTYPKSIGVEDVTYFTQVCHPIIHTV